MLKVGEVYLTKYNNTYQFIKYESSDSFRIDVVYRFDDYSDIDTTNCIASYIYGKDIRTTGNADIVKSIIEIETQATSLIVPDNCVTKVEDGKFVMEITKSDDQLGVRYISKMVSGLNEYQEFETTDGVVKITNFSNTAYDPKNKPVNYDDYEVLGIRSRDVSSSKTSGDALYYSYAELLRMYPEIVHVLKNDYIVVSNYEEAVSRLDTWVNSKEQLKSVDIESLNTLWCNTSNNRITGVFLGVGETWSTYFPFRQDNFEYNLPIEFLRTIFDAINNQPPAPEVLILAHNAKFEIQGFYHEFKDYMRCDVDIYLLATLVNPNVAKGTHTLKALTNRYEGKFYLSLENIFINEIQFNVLPPEIVLLYGCPDATSPAKLYRYLMEELPKDEEFVLKLENKLPVIKAMNEYYGIRLDQVRLDSMIKGMEEKSEILADLFRRMHKTSANINSYQTLCEILYDKLRCPVLLRTDKGAPATSKDAINLIINSGKISVDENTIIPNDVTALIDGKNEVLLKGSDLAANKYPSLIVYQMYKKMMKELGALKRLKRKSVDESFMFYINQAGAGSNRQTSDAQQFSDTMKSLALADSPYHKLVSCDWKQIELRVLAGLAGQKDLMELEADPDVDIHRAIFSIINNKPMWQISEEDRKKAKPVNFGVVYMMSEYGLANREFGPSYTKEQLNSKRDAITAFFNGLPNIKYFVNSNKEFLAKNGYIKTAFNYYRYFRELLDPTLDKKIAKSMIRSGNNTPVQGTAAQLLKISETKVFEYIRSRGWDKCKDYGGKSIPMVRMMLPIHDEILLSYDKNIPIEDIIVMFKECMELDFDTLPPLFAAPAFIDNWLEAKNPVYEVDITFRDKIVEERRKGNYILSGKDYVQTLIEYREDQIKDYMEDLIRKYKTEEEVAKHVRHDSLTHTLIETMMPNSKERKSIPHEERIVESVHRYMNNLQESGKLETVLNTVVDDEDVMSQDGLDVDEWADSYVIVNKDGDVEIEELEGSYEDSTAYDANIEVPFTEEENEAPIVMFLFNEALVDITRLDSSEKRELLYEKLKSLNKSDGYYNIIIVDRTKTFNTNIRVGYCEKEILDIYNSII